MPPSRRDDLIEAALRVFSRNGFHGSGVEKVLQEGGISRMTLYNHFKSKDELILATLRRRDEIFRNQMMKFVESRASDPIGRILAVFDHLQEWFEGDEFCGCMFINASAEFSDPDSPIRCAAADHKAQMTRYLKEQCEAAGISPPEPLAQQLSLLVEGAIVSAHVVGQVRGSAPIGEAAHHARQAAVLLIEGHRTCSSSPAKGTLTDEPWDQSAPPTEMR